MDITISRAAVRVGAIMIALCAAFGCSFSENRKEAEQLADRYFSMMQGSDVEAVLALYSPRFYAVTPRADWLSFLKNQRARCGVPKSHSLVTWNVFSSMGADAGVRATLVYDVHYSNCQVSEKITTFKSSDGKIQILGHFLAPKLDVPDDKTAAQATLKT